MPLNPTDDKLTLVIIGNGLVTGDPLHSRALAHSRAPLLTQPCPHCSHSRDPGEQWARLCVFTLQGCVQAARLCRGSPVLVPSGNKPLPEPMLTQIFRCHQMVSLGHNELKKKVNCLIPSKYGPAFWCEEYDSFCCSPDAMNLLITQIFWPMSLEIINHDHYNLIIYHIPSDRNVWH